MQATHDALPRRKEQIAWSRLWWVGALVIASSLTVNLLVRSAILALFPTQIITADHIIMLTVLGTLAAILVFALVAWRATRPITLYRRIAVVALLLSFAPDILIFSTGYSGIVVGAYILMHIMTAAICIIGLTKLMEVK